MNERIKVVVTSALQTAAGRMIFAKPAHSGRGIDTEAAPTTNGKSSRNQRNHKS